MSIDDRLDDMSVIYIKRIGVNVMGDTEYEFYLSDTPDIAWAEDWAEQCPSACSFMEPEASMYSDTVRLCTSMPLALVQENSCFSYQDCIDKIVAMAWEDISSYEDYPEPYRVVVHFGTPFHEVRTIFGGREIWFDGYSVDEVSDDE